jgi:PleD family two-component response regulator
MGVGAGGRRSVVGADELETSGETRLPPRPRVLLADDHPRLRQALRDLLVETGFEVVGESESPELERQAREAGAFAYLDKGTMVRRVHRVLLGAAVRAVLAANAGPAS